MQNASTPATPSERVARAQALRDASANAGYAPIALWRTRMGLSQRAAAASLGMSLSSYQDQERGTNRTTGAPIRTPLSLLLACAALEHDIPPIG